MIVVQIVIVVLVVESRIRAWCTSILPLFTLFLCLMAVKMS